MSGACEQRARQGCELVRRTHSPNSGWPPRAFARAVEAGPIEGVDMSNENEKRAVSNVNRKSSAEGMDETMRKRIQKRAYELFEESGAQHGHDMEHWMQAESEILQQTQLHRAA